MKRFLFILIALSCLFACKKQEQEVLPPEDPDTPEENEEVPPTPYDADDVDWAAGLGYVFDDTAYVREIFCYDLFHRNGVWTAVNNIYSRLWLQVGEEKEVYYGVYEMMEHIDKDFLRARVDQFGSNYFLYLAPDKNDDYKVWLIPYDYDNTLGTSHNYCAQTDSGRQDPWKWGMESAPLMTKILKNAEWAALYKKYLQDLCAEGGDFHFKTAMARIRAWQSTVAPFVSNDTQEDMAIEDKPGWWGNHHEYRIMEEGENNFFQVKAEAVGKM